ncbi:hypothetical protein [Immundisolibacter cernigliae]|nr:hypothetical protein [Immundisolibacter cernigliae]
MATEPVVHLVQRHIDLKDGTPLRRYVDLPKYIDLLRSQSLYLRRADRFTDKFEGALTPAIRKAINAAHTRNPLSESAEDFYRRCRMSTFISCWSLGAEDNMALWQLYGGASTSLTINTTAGRLTTVCDSWAEPILIQKVRYIDHFENPDMVIGRCTDPLQFKHEAYEFEREVRLLMPRQDDWEKNPEGMQRRLPSLDALITSVVVAPEADAWFLELVEDVTQRYGLKAPVRMSALAQFPA